MLDVADSIGSELQSVAVIALRSTVPVGTTRRVERRLNESLKRRGLSQQVAVIANPEFLRTGRALEDFLHPTRVVLGTTELATDADVARLRSLYEPLESPLLVMDAASAELVKNAANAFLATKISFVNELASLCEATGRICRCRDPRPGAGPADRRRLHAAGTRLWRVVLAQGRALSDRDGHGAWAADGPRPGRRRHQPQPARALRAAAREGAGRPTGRRDRSSSASHSSRTRTTSGTRRRSTSPAPCATGAPSRRV